VKDYLVIYTQFKISDVLFKVELILPIVGWPAYNCVKDKCTIENGRFTNLGGSILRFG